MSQDNLKDIFNEAFAAESIPFDNAAWQEMNKLLIAQRRRKLFFGWFSGGTAALALLLGIYFLQLHSVASYMPRENNFSFEEFTSEHIHADIALAKKSIGQSSSEVKVDDSSVDQNPLNTVASEETPQAQKIEKPNAASIKTKESFSRQNEKTPSIAESVETPTMAVSASFKNEGSIEENISETSPAERLTVASMEDIGVPSIVFYETIPSNDLLELMPILAIENNTDQIAFEDRTVPNITNKRSLNTYLNIGFSKSFDRPAASGFSRWGQRGGIGATYQLQNKLLLAAEISIARDMVNYEEVSTRTEYGYEKYVFEQTVRVKEMLLTELPLLIYFRQNRLMVGSGIKLGYLLSSRIEEENSQTVTIEDVGFANWKDLNSMRVSIPIDVNYQLNSTYFVGCRYHYGLNDVFDRTAFTDRNNRFDLYIKMNLTR